MRDGNGGSLDAFLKDDSNLGQCLHFSALTTAFVVTGISADIKTNTWSQK